MPPIPRRPADRTVPVGLTAEQRAAVEHLLSFPKDVQTLGGYAGTGKTTVIKTLKARLPGFAVCAYTGKAANVLRVKGVPAIRIHSLIYRADERDVIDARGRRRTVVTFERRPPAEVACSGFLVDEASMVDRATYADLLSFGRPVLFVGDHGQLEPVSGDRFDLMASPDVTLETIHRNAGEIARFAEFVRKGNAPANWPRHRDYVGGRVRVLTLDRLDGVPDPDAIICAFNATRVGLNRFVRDHYGLPPDRPAVGDRVMCLQNDHRLGLFNGMQGEFAAAVADEMVFRSGGEDYRVRFVPDRFNAAKAPEARDRTGRLPFDYCYAITCHKAQGDEWDDVLVLEQRCRKWDHARWAYTAASRARRRLYWVTDGWKWR